MRRLTIGLVMASVGMCLLLSSMVAGQDQGPSKSKSPPAPDILSGPKVEPEATQQRNNPGRPNANDPKRQVEIPFQQWAAALRGLGLSQEQQDQARSIVAEFQQTTKEFQNEHGEAMRTLYGEMREARQNGTEPPKEAREKMRRLEEARPKPDPYKERIWELLNEQQQNQMKEKLEAIRKDMMEKRDGRRDVQRPRGDGARRPAAPAALDQKKPDAMNEMSPGESSNDEMMSPPPSRENPGDSGNRRPNAQRGAGAKSSAAGLDARSRKRMEFLLAHQSSARPGSGPTKEQRQFQFDEAASSNSNGDADEPVIRP